MTRQEETVKWLSSSALAKPFSERSEKEGFFIEFAFSRKIPELGRLKNDSVR